LVTSIGAMVVARGVGDWHGGARSRHGRLRWPDDDTAPIGDPTSISGVPMT